MMIRHIKVENYTGQHEQETSASVQLFCKEIKIEQINKKRKREGKKIENQGMAIPDLIF